MARAMQASCLPSPPPTSPRPSSRPCSRGPRGQLGLAALVLALQLLLSWPLTFATAVDPEMCVVRALDTRFFTPWLSVSRRAPGCSSHGQLGPGGTEVHVVRVLLDRGTHGATRGWWLSQGLPLIEIILNATPQNSSSAPLALLLNADRPITWRITVNGVNPNVKHSLTICEQCQVETSLQMQVTRHDWLSKRALLRHTKKFWKAITSYTEVQGGNRIELKVGYGVAGEQSEECNTSSRQLSPVASASLTLPQPTQGCLNEDSIGHNAWDVYIVELARHPGPGTQPVQVLLQGEGPRPVPRNVTLVLKAHRPTRWQLGSRGIDGSIVVVSDQQVENTMDGVRDGIVVRSKNLPDGLDALLLSVFAEFGRPVLYAKTERASGLRLLVASREHEEEQLSGDMAGEEKDTTSTMMHRQVMVQQAAGIPGATFITGLHAQESHAHPLAELRAEMRISCESKRMNVSFPRALVTRLGVRRLALNDPQCVAFNNETHYWLSSHITSCGSISSSSNGATHYSNSVHVRFGSSPAPSDDEDMTEEEASGAFEDPDKDPDKLAVLCKYYPTFGYPNNPGSPSMGGQEDNSPNGNHGNIYQMELYRDYNHTNKLNFPSGAPAEVQFDERLYVRAWIEGVVRVQVVTESCWVSNSSDPTYQHVKVPLVRNTCPVDLSVKIEDSLGPNARPQHGGFSFQVNKAYWQFGLLYVHCKLGVCTQDPAHAIGNLALCVNQAQHCFREALKFYDKVGSMSTALQFVTRGPLQPVAKRRQPSISPPRILPLPPGEKIPGLVLEPPTIPPPEPETESVMQGISTEMAAGIALLSFAIGVMLTASMWCIQIKTDPFRQRQRKEAIQQQQQLQRSSPALGGTSTQASSAAI